VWWQVRFSSARCSPPDSQCRPHRRVPRKQLRAARLIYRRLLTNFANAGVALNDSHTPLRYHFNRATSTNGMKRLHFAQPPSMTRLLRPLSLQEKFVPANSRDHEIPFLNW
jgi:hypothetical protein